MVASRQSLWRGEVKRPSHRLCRWIINWFTGRSAGTRPWSRLSNFLCYGSFKAADPIGVDPATKPEAKPGAQPIDSVVYLDSVDAVKAPVDPVARADELDPIDLLEATE